MKRKNLICLTTAPLLLLPSLLCGQNANSATGHRRLPSGLEMGRNARVDFSRGRIGGELLGVSPDTLWVLSEGTVKGLALQDVSRVGVEKHKWGWKRMLMWNLVGGLSSAIGMTVACNSVEGTSGCGGVFSGVTVSWALIGGITGGLLAASSHDSVRPVPGDLRPYVRYPQGIPPGIRLGNDLARPGGG